MYISTHQYPFYPGTGGESEKVKFRVGARKRYITKTHTTSYQTLTGSFILGNFFLRASIIYFVSSTDKVV